MLTQRDSHPLRVGSDNAPAFPVLGFPEPQGKGLVETSHLGLSVSWSLILWVWVSVCFHLLQSDICESSWTLLHLFVCLVQLQYDFCFVLYFVLLYCVIIS